MGNSFLPIWTLSIKKTTTNCKKCHESLRLTLCSTLAAIQVISTYIDKFAFVVCSEKKENIKKKKGRNNSLKRGNIQRFIFCSQWQQTKSRLGLDTSPVKNTCT